MLREMHKNITFWNWRGLDLSVRHNQAFRTGSQTSSIEPIFIKLSLDSSSQYFQAKIIYNNGGVSFLPL